MRTENNIPKTDRAEEHNDMSPVADEALDSINGAGSPWENVNGVPIQPIDDKLFQRDSMKMDTKMRAR